MDSERQPLAITFSGPTATATVILDEATFRAVARALAAHDLLSYWTAATAAYPELPAALAAAVLKTHARAQRPFVINVPPQPPAQITVQAQLEGPAVQAVRIVSMPSPPETVTTVEERDAQGRVKRARKKPVARSPS